MQLYVLVLAFLASAVSISVVHAQSSKTCNLKEVDMCLTNFYYDQKGIPTNERQMRKLCSATKTLHKCVNTYINRCMGRALRETFQIIMDSVTKNAFDLCAKPSGHSDRQDVFKFGPCINQNQKKMSSCAEIARDTIFFSFENDYTRRVPIACCNFRRMSECTYEKTTELCSKDHANFARKMDPLYDSLREICSPYDPKSETCAEYMIPAGWKTKEDPKAPLARMINAFF